MDNSMNSREEVKDILLLLASSCGGLIGLRRSAHTNDFINDNLHVLDEIEAEARAAFGIVG